MSNQEKALVSVIVPIYKVEKWLSQCLESILRQTYANLEIILVDDGSPDRCGQICDQFAAKDSRIVVIHKENGGVSEARNYGLDRATGEYIGFVDPDDYVEPDMIERLIEDLEREKAEIAACNFIREYEIACQYPQAAAEYQIKQRAAVTGEKFIYLQGKYQTFGVALWNKLYRKEIWNGICFPVGKVHEDWFVFYQIIYPCRRIVCDPYVGYHYRIRKDGIIGQGGNFFDSSESNLEHCRYFIANGNQRLALLCENQVANGVANGVYKNIYKHRHTDAVRGLMKGCFQLDKELYQKGWISPCKLLRRRLLFSWLGMVASVCWAGIEHSVKQSSLLYRIWRKIKQR